MKLFPAKLSSPSLALPSLARSGRYIFFGLLAYIIFLCVMLPAERGYGLIKEKVAPLRLYQLHGSVWSGSAGMAVAGTRQMQNVQWTLRPWMLLLGRIEASIEFDEAGRHTQTVLGRTLGGTIYLADVKTQLPPAALENALNIPGSGLDGAVDVALSDVKFTDVKLTTLEGTLSWNNAALFVTRTSPKTKLGSFVMTLTTKSGGTGNEINGVLKDNPASPLRADGILRIKPDGTYQFTGSLALRDASRADLVQALRLFGSPGPGGKIPLSATGTVPVLSF